MKGAAEHIKIYTVRVFKGDMYNEKDNFCIYNSIAFACRMF